MDQTISIVAIGVVYDFIVALVVYDFIVAKRRAAQERRNDGNDC